MVRLNAAYEVLSVPDRKYLYDSGEPVDYIYDKSYSTKYESSSEYDGVPWYTKYVPLVIVIVWVTYVTICIYQAHYGTHYWLTLEVKHFYTTIGMEGSDDSSYTTEVHVVGIDNQSRTHDLRIEIHNGEQSINVQDEYYQSKIGKKFRATELLFPHRQ